MAERKMQVEVMRYDPDRDTVPRYETFSVDCDPDWVVLDALNKIKDDMDDSLSFRWSCHMAVCGSCGMMVNGEPVLGCKTFIRDFPEKIRVEPLENFPVERDLVIDMDGFMEKLNSVKPYVIPKEPKSIEQGDYLQSPTQLKASKQCSMCINCLCCYAACPQVALNDDFIGPAALALAHRYNLDNRDVGRSAREDIVARQAHVQWTPAERVLRAQQRARVGVPGDQRPVAEQVPHAFLTPARERREHVIGVGRRFARALEA